jgi:hypothetical protein
MLAEQIRFVTGNFYQLQGLRLVPFAFVLLWAAASSAGWLEWLPGRPVTRPGDIGNIWGPILFIAAVVMAMTIEGHYKARYGAVLQTCRAQRNLGLGVAVIAFLITLVLDRLLELPVRMSPLVIVISLGVIVRADGPFRAHYLIPAAAWLGVSAMPVLGFHVEVIGTAYLLIGALSLFVCGVGDHWLIVRTLASSRKRLHVAKSSAV